MIWISFGNIVLCNFLNVISMNTKLKYIALLAILPLVMIGLSPDFIGEADAQKSQGSPGKNTNGNFGSATDHIVCGGRLCSTPEGSEDPLNVSKPR